MKQILNFTMELLENDHSLVIFQRLYCKFVPLYHNTLITLYFYGPQTQHYRSRLVRSIIIPPANFVCGGYTVFTSVRVRPSVTFCFFNILKSHCWIFIKPCKHVHICKTNTLDKKVRARGQFYKSYFPL